MDKFERYWKLSDMEERYNRSAAGIRSLASAWLLATLGSIGWLFSSFRYDTWPVPLGFLVILVTTLGSLGLVTLWVMDQLVFHRLLTTVFLVGLKMEKDDPELPPIRSLMIKTQEGLGTHRWETIFYLVPVCVFLLISGMLLFSGSERLFGVGQPYLRVDMRSLSMLLGAGQVAAVLWMVSRFRSMSVLARHASSFGDPEFAGLIADRQYEQTIVKFRSIQDQGRGGSAD